MKIAPLAALLCALPLAGCYVVPYPGGALTLSPTPDAPQAMRAAPGTPGAADYSAPPAVQATPTPAAAALPPPPKGRKAVTTYPHGSPVPADFPAQTSTSAPPPYPNGSPVPPDYVPPPSAAVQAPVTSTTYAPAYATYPVYPTYPTYYAAYPAYAPYPPAYPAYYRPYAPGFAPYPWYAPDPWASNVSVSFSWGSGWGPGYRRRCCWR